jgi:hypothetical protein
VMTIDVCVFRGYSSLTQVTVPRNTRTIGDFALEGCSALGKMVIQSHAVPFASCAFHLCSSLKQLIVPPSVTTRVLWLFGSDASDCSSAARQAP